MLILDARGFHQLVRSITDSELRFRNLTGPFTDYQKGNMREGVRDVLAQLEALDMPVSIKVLRSLSADCDTSEKFHRLVDHLNTTVLAELQGRRFYGPIRKYEPYYEQPKLFGDEVFANFPSSNEDIAEAGTCLALERATASVMHSMRIVEAGLAVLARTVGVSKQNNWGSYLREIDNALVAKVKASGARSVDEQFYAEAAAMIDNMRRAYRNPTMHPEKTYTPDRAEEILQSVRSFMRHLATKLHE
jgi:hypothetical protein